MNPHDNLGLARFLHGKPKGAPDEAATRGACGRAYYSAFGVIRDILETARFNVPSRGAHETVLNLLQRSSDKDVLHVASMYQQLRRTRDDSDYDVGLRTKAPFGTRESERAIGLSEKIISQVEEVAKKEPTLSIST